MLTRKEIDYINSQHLARLATASQAGQPDVAAVGFRFDSEKFVITGFDITKTFKYKNVKAGNPLVSLVIDDLASIQTWVARGIKTTAILSRTSSGSTCRRASCWSTTSTATKPRSAWRCA